MISSLMVLLICSKQWMVYGIMLLSSFYFLFHCLQSYRENRVLMNQAANMDESALGEVPKSPLILSSPERLDHTIEHPEIDSPEMANILRLRKIMSGENHSESK